LIRSVTGTIHCRADLKQVSLSADRIGNDFRHFSSLHDQCHDTLSGHRSPDEKHDRPEFADIFYLAGGVSFVNMLLIFLLFQKIGIFVPIPCLTAGCYIPMRFGGLAILHALAILMAYEVIQFLLPI
jgi:hypothetical protein